jgi:hypothetical protein
VGRWLERAPAAAGRFNDRMTRGYEPMALNLQEMTWFRGNDSGRLSEAAVALRTPRR